MSLGRPLPNTLLLRSSKNRCAYSSSSFRSAAACPRFEVLPEPRGVEGTVGVFDWVSEVAGCLGTVVRFFGSISREGVPATGGVILIGFFADLGGSLKRMSYQGQPSVYMRDSLCNDRVVKSIFEYVVG